MRNVVATAAAAVDEPEEAAEVAGLRYVSDDDPGIRRRRCGKGFAYYDLDDNLIRDGSQRDRIKSLAVPPAWTDVWICPDPTGHLQATGRDDRGRKQYRYHDRWREVRDATKFHRLRAFGHALTRVRAAVHRDLRLRSMSRQKVLAIAVALLDESLIRVGNDEYTRTNGSYGLTTLRSEHLDLSSTQVRLHFVGKGGKKREVTVRDRRLARMLKRCEEIPGQCLFTYESDYSWSRVESGDINDWLRATTGEDFTSKDFRTWGGTVVAAARLHELRPAASDQEAERKLLAAIDAAAERLGNTRAVARSGYVHPAVPLAFSEGTLSQSFDAAEESEWLGRDDVAVLKILDWAAG
ncbi:MAG: DNA topoisomerase IB [Actinomycetota bacterium]|nr:DNA topoisomerase IB [Actinomycetota bacterium]